MNKIEDYHILRVIGEGSFAKVYSGRKVGGLKIVALKAIVKKGKSLKDLKTLKSEIDVLKNVKHPNVIQLFDCKENSEELILVTEYAETDLHTILKDDKFFEETEVRRLTKQLISALHFLHSNRVLHRDLKPQNILLSKDGNVKLCDFGFARLMSFETMVVTSIKGTPLYMSPELLEEKPYDHNVDLWALGCIIFEMRIGQPPYYATNLYQLMKIVLKENIKWPSKDVMSSDLQSLLMQLLERKPENRLTWPLLLDHPFVKDDGDIILHSFDISKAPLTAELTEEQRNRKKKQIKQYELRGSSNSVLAKARRHYQNETENKKKQKLQFVEKQREQQKNRIAQLAAKNFKSETKKTETVKVNKLDETLKKSDLDESTATLAPQNNEQELDSIDLEQINYKSNKKESSSAPTTNRKAESIKNEEGDDDNYEYIDHENHEGMVRNETNEWYTLFERLMLLHNDMATAETDEGALQSFQEMDSIIIPLISNQKFIEQFNEILEHNFLSFNESISRYLNNGQLEQLINKDHVQMTSNFLTNLLHIAHLMFLHLLKRQQMENDDIYVKQLLDFLYEQQIFDLIVNEIHFLLHGNETMDKQMNRNDIQTLLNQMLLNVPNIRDVLFESVNFCQLFQQIAPLANLYYSTLTESNYNMKFDRENDFMKKLTNRHISNLLKLCRSMQSIWNLSIMINIDMFLYQYSLCIFIQIFEQIEQQPLTIANEFFSFICQTDKQSKTDSITQLKSIITIALIPFTWQMTRNENNKFSLIQTTKNLGNFQEIQFEKLSLEELECENITQFNHRLNTVKNLAATLLTAMTFMQIDHRIDIDHYSKIHPNYSKDIEYCRCQFRNNIQEIFEWKSSERSFPINYSQKYEMTKIISRKFADGQLNISDLLFDLHQPLSTLSTIFKFLYSCCQTSKEFCRYTQRCPLKRLMLFTSNVPSTINYNNNKEIRNLSLLQYFSLRLLSSAQNEMDNECLKLRLEAYELCTHLYTVCILNNPEDISQIDIKICNSLYLNGRTSNICGGTSLLYGSILKIIDNQNSSSILMNMGKGKSNNLYEFNEKSDPLFQYLNSNEDIDIIRDLLDENQGIIINQMDIMRSLTIALAPTKKRTNSFEERDSLIDENEYIKLLIDGNWRKLFFHYYVESNKSNNSERRGSTSTGSNSLTSSSLVVPLIPFPYKYGVVDGIILLLHALFVDENDYLMQNALLFQTDILNLLAQKIYPLLSWYRNKDSCDLPQNISQLKYRFDPLYMNAMSILPLFQFIFKICDDSMNNCHTLLFGLFTENKSEEVMSTDRSDTDSGIQNESNAINDNNSSSSLCLFDLITLMIDPNILISLLFELNEYEKISQRLSNASITPISSRIANDLIELRNPFMNMTFNNFLKFSHMHNVGVKDLSEKIVSNLFHSISIILCMPFTLSYSDESMKQLIKQYYIDKKHFLLSNCLKTIIVLHNRNIPFDISEPLTMMSYLLRLYGKEILEHNQKHLFQRKKRESPFIKDVKTFNNLITKSQIIKKIFLYIWIINRCSTQNTQTKNKKVEMYSKKIFNNVGEYEQNFFLTTRISEDTLKDEDFSDLSQKKDLEKSIRLQNIITSDSLSKSLIFSLFQNISDDMEMSDDGNGNNKLSNPKTSLRYSLLKKKLNNVNDSNIIQKSLYDFLSILEYLLRLFVKNPLHEMTQQKNDLKENVSMIIFNSFETFKSIIDLLTMGIEGKNKVLLLSSICQHSDENLMAISFSIVSQLIYIQSIINQRINNKEKSQCILHRLMSTSDLEKYSSFFSLDDHPFSMDIIVSNYMPYILSKSSQSKLSMKWSIIVLYEMIYFMEHLYYVNKKIVENYFIFESTPSTTISKNKLNIFQLYNILQLPLVDDIVMKVKIKSLEILAKLAIILPDFSKYVRSSSRSSSGRPTSSRPVYRSRNSEISKDEKCMNDHFANSQIFRQLSRIFIFLISLLPEENISESYISNEEIRLQICILNVLVKYCERDDAMIFVFPILIQTNIMKLLHSDDDSQPTHSRRTSIDSINGEKTPSISTLNRLHVRLKVLFNYYMKKTGRLRASSQKSLNGIKSTISSSSSSILLHPANDSIIHSTDSNVTQITGTMRKYAINRPDSCRSDTSKSNTNLTRKPPAKSRTNIKSANNRQNSSMVSSVSSSKLTTDTCRLDDGNSLKIEGKSIKKCLTERRILSARTPRSIASPRSRSRSNSSASDRRPNLSVR
ncbi:hypothetical protein SNEBB_009619 [Seison nebaliae]|nr:hypothetical protein SNEBB_009619 [Seison nebaliae]